MNIVEKTIDRLDRFQRKHHLLAFSYGVINKYGDDEAGYQAALLTYYGFLSLFPLLLVVTTITGLLGPSYPEFQKAVITATNNYLPVLGGQISEHVGGLHKSGFALIVGILFTIYGARGVADAFRHGVNHIWQVPYTKRDGFPKSVAKSLGLIFVGGLGLLAASVCAGLAASAGYGPLFRFLSLMINVAILFGLFTVLLNLSLPNHVTIRQARPGAIAAAVGLVIMQSLGSYLLTRELKNLDALYSYFAIALGLLFWIYLQAQVLYYATEIAVVHSQGLWPRSLSGRNLTPADKRTLAQHAGKEKLVEVEDISTRFKD